MAILLALFSSDATRDIIVSARASIAGVLPTPSAAAQPDATRLTALDIQLKDSARLSAPANQTPGVQGLTTVAVAPTRAEITTAYQSALQGRVPAAATPTAPPPARKLEADELATLPATELKSDADKQALFKQFQAWAAEQNAKAQLRPAPQQR